MTGSVAASDVATEIVLAELAYLVHAAGGDPATLNAPATLRSYFERPEVIAVGKELQALRRADDADSGATARYFDAVGTVLARSESALVVRTAGRRGLATMYFLTDGAFVSVTVDDGTSVLTLGEGRPVISPGEPGQDGSATVVGRFGTDGARSYLAVQANRAARSDDGETWTDVASDRAAAVRLWDAFVTG